MKNKNWKKILGYLFMAACMILLVVTVIKLVIYDCIIGNKLFDDNDVVVRYHRYINIVTIDNNSDEMIYMHYLTGYAKKDANGDRYANSVRYTGGRSDVYEIEANTKLVEHTGILGDGFLFVISYEESDWQDVCSFNKREWW